MSELSFTAFLSHRYKSPDINLYFFELFSTIAEVQFYVDEGSFSTNVTRLERLIRSSEAFIGIYPCAVEFEKSDANKRALLEKSSRYFRLELDLAIRSRKPALVFYDQRYKNVIRCPSNILAVPFKANEITSGGRVPRTEVYRRAFKSFCEIVEAARKYQTTQDPQSRTTIAIAVPPEKEGIGYSADTIEAIEEVLDEETYNDRDDRVVVKYPPILKLAKDSFSLFQSVDWMIVDVGEAMASTGLPGYLHGQFIPTMRIRQTLGVSEVPTPSLFEQVMFGGVEVGYAKDIIGWHDRDELVSGLKKRLQSLQATQKLIATSKDADEYFRSASLRKANVFLSYAEEDYDLATVVSAELSKYFQTVFDYKKPSRDYKKPSKDRKKSSLSPGEDWMPELYEVIAQSQVGIPLLSEAYFASNYCREEIIKMKQCRVSSKMKTLIPLKVSPSKLELPEYLKGIQYLTCVRAEAVEETIQRVVQQVDGNS